jgi:hypothetical protein
VRLGAAVAQDEAIPDDIQRVLLQSEFANLPGVIPKRAQIISRVIEIAKKNNDTVLYACVYRKPHPH